MTASGPARELMPRLRLIHVPATRSPPPDLKGGIFPAELIKILNIPLVYDYFSFPQAISDIF
jgi:hypothetical protein